MRTRAELEGELQIVADSVGKAQTIMNPSAQNVYDITSALRDIALTHVLTVLLDLRDQNERIELLLTRIELHEQVRIQFAEKQEFKSAS